MATALKPEEICVSINELRELDPTSVSRVEELGSLNFLEAKERLSQTLELYRQIDSELWDRLPAELHSSVVAGANALKTTVDAMLRFSTSTQNPANERSALVSQLNSQSAEAIRSLVWLPLLQNKSDALKKASVLTNALAGKLDEVTATLEEARQALAAAREAAAQTVVTQQVSHFGGAAAIDQASANRWL